MRKWLTKVGFTAFFLAWEAQKRVRGAWRRREWRKLGGFGMRLGVLVLLISAYVALIACGE
ncbi:MAG: hypothetical protein RSG22_02605 [Comamonas sp.]